MNAFENQESEYEDWLRAHTEGFVFNHFAGSNPADDVIHRSSCSFLHRERDAGARTGYAKICSDDLAEVEAEATSLRGGRDGWVRCSVCW